MPKPLPNRSPGRPEAEVGLEYGRAPKVALLRLKIGLPVTILLNVATLVRNCANGMVGWGGPSRSFWDLKLVLLSLLYSKQQLLFAIVIIGW